jgi:endonuclease/exonuclease/phosphatase family metal-dependent hydrolase
MITEPLQESIMFKVISLNLAHGRRNAWHQALLRRAVIRANLDEVVRIIQQEQPDVIALQEADGPSLWSGRFHHVAYLAQQTGIRHFVLGQHVSRLKLAYGTALVSRHLLRDAFSHRFTPSRPMPSKGMVMGTVRWPDPPELRFDVASVHLDFSRRQIRLRQAREIIDRLAPRRRPLVLMGDFNCGFRGRDPTLSILARELGLTAHEPLSTEMVSFPSRNKRFDWVLISPEFEFVDYRTLPDVLSDHRAVVATLRLAKSA